MKHEMRRSARLSKKSKKNKFTSGTEDSDDEFVFGLARITESIKKLGSGRVSKKKKPKTPSSEGTPPEPVSERKQRSLERRRSMLKEKLRNVKLPALKALVRLKPETTQEEAEAKGYTVYTDEERKKHLKNYKTPVVCSSCDVRKGSIKCWRKGPFGSQSLCNVCYRKWRQKLIQLDQYGHSYTGDPDQVLVDYKEMMRVPAYLYIEDYLDLRKDTTIKPPTPEINKKIPAKRPPRRSSRKRKVVKTDRAQLGQPFYGNDARIRCGAIGRRGPCRRPGKDSLLGRCTIHANVPVIQTSSSPSPPSSPETPSISTPTTSISVTTTPPSTNIIAPIVKEKKYIHQQTQTDMMVDEPILAEPLTINNPPKDYSVVQMAKEKVPVHVRVQRELRQVNRHLHRSQRAFHRVMQEKNAGTSNVFASMNTMLHFHAKHLYPNGPFSPSVLATIFSFLGPYDTVSMGCVCHLWAYAANHHDLWMHFYAQRWPVHLANVGAAFQTGPPQWRYLYRVRSNPRILPTGIERAMYFLQFYAIENNPDMLALAANRVQEEHGYYTQSQTKEDHMQDQFSYDRILEACLSLSTQGN